MKNILTFEDYKKMNIRQVESVIYHQFIDNDIKNEVSEGFIRNAINIASGKFIQSALADEIEKGKELEKSIHEALDGLNKGFDEIKHKIEGDTANIADSKTKLDAIEKVKEAIKAVQSQAFDTLTMIGSEGEIDFAGFMGSASVVAATRFGIILTPISSIFITRKAYKYFLGIIKQTIRRNLLVIQLNFDQFENLILQKSFEAEGESEMSIKRDALNEIIGAMTQELCSKNSKLGIIKGEKNIKNMKEYLSAFQSAQKTERDFNRNSPLTSLWQDQHNNTYTRTLEQIKQYINDDSQKELDALKNSITKMAGNDVDLAAYGELLISAAEEYAIQTNHGINNNFIKMSSVFNLDNQKKLIELIVATQKEHEEEISKRDLTAKLEEENEEFEKDVETGKDLYNNKLSKKTYTFDDFEKEFSNDDIKCLKAYFQTEEGKKVYNDINDKNPLYKYFLENIPELNNFLTSINSLKVVAVSDMDEYSKYIVNPQQALYYMMAEKSIQDAVESKKSEEYFGFRDIISDKDEDTYIKENFLKEEIVQNKTKINSILGSILGKKTITTKGGLTKKIPKTKYFLTFNGDGENLFNILHKDFKTKIFKGDKTYVDNIKTQNKENIIKLIHKHFKIGNSITTQFAEYLVRLEAHMLLENRDDWFVVKNNDELKNCFKPNSLKILNKNAFVEISEDDYNDIKTFLSKFHKLSDNDFNMETEEKKK